MSAELSEQDLAKDVVDADWLQRLVKPKVLAHLQKIEQGRLRIVDGHSETFCGESLATAGAEFTLRVRDPAFYTEVALGGAVGGAEAYMQGFWDCEDLTGFIRLLIRNRHVLDSIETGLARLKAPLRRYAHWQRRNHRDNSRQNIQAHYDLGNDFFELFLDETMMYSAAIFPAADADLKTASEAKLERICRQLQLSAEDHVMEIGTGWGGFALYAARNFGCRVTSTTISEEQFQLARAKVSEAGLNDRVTILKRDYRDLEGKFDKLVSIEMFEAVGHRYYDTFFAKCDDLLKDDGEMLLQTITIAEQQYERSRRNVDFIQKYIFPGGALPSLSVIADCVARKTGMRVVNLIDIGPHYAETLRRWRDRFTANIPAVWRQGFPNEFLRMWHYYLCYCEAGFDERVIGDLQLHLQKPGCQSLPAEGGTTLLSFNPT